MDYNGIHGIYPVVNVYLTMDAVERSTVLMGQLAINNDYMIMGRSSMLNG